MDIAVARGELLKSAASSRACAFVALVASCHGPAPRPHPIESTLVLHEVHRAAGSDPDTLVTTIGEAKARVEHSHGVAILDLGANRYVLLDPATRTERSMALDAWERELRSTGASAGDTSRAASPRVLRFESEGDGGTIAGHACERYHLFTTHTVLPGETEDIEQEIWVTRDIAVKPATLATYRRIIEDLDWIALDAQVVRPDGIALRNQVRRHGIDRSHDEVEATEVVRIETGAVTRHGFEIPPGYRAATDSTPHD